MKVQNLLDELTEVILTEKSFISDGEILKNAVIEAALKLDPKLLKLLLQSDALKKQFFTEVEEYLVFDKVKFQAFVSNKKYLPDSYTAFMNRIGLSDRNGAVYLSQRSDLVLTWPYKDCVLEGGMTNEDNGRDEIFWNTTLAPDEISRLFEPKVLIGWECWDEEALTTGRAKQKFNFKENDNLLIKGNNLLALVLVKSLYVGGVRGLTAST